ncbi:MAG: nucleotidyltransferase family protein [Candidatus Weimeria sp.]
MSRVGIIAEFNPLHTGHKYIIDYAKNNLKADSVVVALGNEFTQRGGIALIDRYSRARAAADAGADLVVGMPVIASCASAEIFAGSGVSLLSACGCDRIVCGAEGFSSENLLKSLACVLTEEPDKYKEALRSGLKSGLSFPAARSLALSACFPDHKSEIDHFLKEPNNILALEYQKAILRYSPDIELIPIKRQGVGHHAVESENGYASASYIRKAVQNGALCDIRQYLTKTSYEILSDAYQKNLLLYDNDLSLPLHLALLSAEKQDNPTDPSTGDFSCFSDVSDDLSERIKRFLPEYVNFSQFADLLKNKSLTASRIRRSLIHILLGIRDSDTDTLRKARSAPYLWILSASDQGLSMLGDIKNKSHLPLFFSINEKAAEEAKPLLQPDLNALSLARALRIEKSGHSLPNENQRRVTMN